MKKAFARIGRIFSKKPFYNEYSFMDEILKYLNSNKMSVFSFDDISMNVSRENMIIEGLELNWYKDIVPSSDSKKADAFLQSCLLHLKTKELINCDPSFNSQIRIEGITLVRKGGIQKQENIKNAKVILQSLAWLLTIITGCFLAYKFLKGTD